MQKRISVGLTLLLSSVAWFSSLAVIVLPPGTVVKTITLTWDYPEMNDEIVFNVYGTTNLAAPMTDWQLITNVTELSCTIPMREGSHFFVVSASNVVSGLESSFSAE
jgi:hypothetical protein